MLRKNELNKMEIELKTNPLVQGLKIKNYYTMHKQEIDKNFIETFRKVFKQAYELQQERKKGAIAYIVISIIKVAIIDERYEVRIDLYDETYCMDSIEASINWNVAYIFKFIDDEIDTFIDKNKMNLKHIKNYERNALKLKCLPAYENLLYAYLKMNIGKLLELNEYQQLQCERKIEVLFGEYLDEVNSVVDIEKEEVDYGILSNNTGSRV